VVAQGLAKEAIDAGLDGSLDAGLALERHLFVESFGTADSRIGLESFRAAGPNQAHFTGR
jgi:hypothetical protein